jgi:hypothetical protein
MEFTITAARNPQWVDSNHNRIDLEVNFAELEEEWLPYTADPLDVCAHSRTLYANAVAGDYGQVSNEYVLTEDDMWTPVTRTNTKISSEALVQILLEKGVITDEEVDEILVDEEFAVGFTKPTKDGSNPVYHSPMSGSGS